MMKNWFSLKLVCIFFKVFNFYLFLTLPIYEFKIVQSRILGSAEQNHVYESKEIEIPPEIEDVINKIPRNQIIDIDYDCGVLLSCLSFKTVLDMLREKLDNEEFLDVLKADEQHSDLLPMKYEGGLKTWECTKDLINFFIKQVIEEKKIKLNGKSVLDLGCGSGLLGIVCLSQGAQVTFQDYNKEVLEAMTIPNIFINCKNLDRNRIKLYSGDWSSFLELLIHKNGQENYENEKFDYILTSETIYNPGNYTKIIAIIKKFLKSEGRAYVAAKSYYFGVGGNLRDFESLLHEEGLNSRMCWETKEGVSRGIIKVNLKLS